MTQPRPTRCFSLVTETFSPEINGVANTLTQLVNGLLQRGHQLEVIRPRQQDDDHSGMRDGIEHLTVKGYPIPGYRDLNFGLPCKRRLIKRWKKHPPAAIYVATEGPLGLSAVAAAKTLNIPVVSGFHTNFHSYSQFYGVGWLQAMIVTYLRWFHNRTQGTLVPTSQQKRLLYKQGFHNVSVMARGVDCQRFDPSQRDPELRAQWGLNDDDIAVIYVGRLAAEKNIPLAVNTFLRMRAQDPRLKLVLVGSGPLQHALQQKHPEFIFCGMRTGQDLARHYASGDIFLFPSKTETFGNVLTEAMASGLGVVSFNDAAAAEHVVHHQNGMTAPLHNDEAFIRHALELVHKPALLQAVRSAARNTALTIDWPSIVTEFEHQLLATQLTGDKAYGAIKGIQPVSQSRSI